MKVKIKKELCNPKNGLQQIGPFYHIYVNDKDGNEKELAKFEDIKEAARFAERHMDLNLIEVAYQENPLSFRSTITEEEYKALNDARKGGSLNVMINEESPWVSVNNNLPDLDEDVFVAINDGKGGYIYASYKGYLVIEDTKDKESYVEYWMSVPKIR